MDMQHFLEFLKWLGLNLALLTVAILIALVLHAIIIFILTRLAKRTTTPFDELAVARCANPSRWIIVVAALWLACDLADIPPGLEILFRHLISVTFIVLTAWLLSRILDVGRQVLLSRYQVGIADDLHARAVHTQIKVLERIIFSGIIVVAFGCILMTFEGVRQLGVSLLASAGIVGIILGLAAQRVLGSVIAGLQLAITQPIRIEDVVQIENETGIVEEITLTYIVVRVWDLRRLIVPVGYFLDRSFQNWTRSSSAIIGTVFLYVDCNAPIEPIRTELQRILEESPEWDKKVGNLLVTNISERTVELRAAMSSANSTASGALRVQVRERLLEFLRTQLPEAFPKVRMESLAPPAVSTPVGPPVPPAPPAPPESNA